MSTPEISISVATYEHDKFPTTFFYDSWIRSFRGTWERLVGRDLEDLANSRASYHGFMSGQIKPHLESGVLLFAHPTTQPEIVLGWICGTVSQTQTVVHYTYVKKPFRQQGLATLMFERLEEVCQQKNRHNSPVLQSCPTPWDSWKRSAWKKKYPHRQLVLNPSLLFRPRQ